MEKVTYNEDGSIDVFCGIYILGFEPLFLRYD